MKKIIIATFALLGMLSVQAQKNSILVGTAFGYERTNGFGDSKANEFTFTPLVAYEVADNWFIGARTNLGYSETSFEDASAKTKVKQYETRVGGFVRYYYPFNSTFGFFSELGAGYQQYRGNGTVTVAGVSADAVRARGYGYYVNFEPSLFVNFRNNFGLNISIGGIEWNDTKTNEAKDYDNTYKQRSFDLTLGKAISVGIVKKFSF